MFKEKIFRSANSFIHKRLQITDQQGFSCFLPARFSKITPPQFFRFSGMKLRWPKRKPLINNNYYLFSQSQ